ncbi:DUF5309 family protein [Streptomyces sp. ND04-05B]|uniref:SU10 major capsid protein n=1 Tax=Streptomyces sp. ND04-05B TaxID=3028693 RepID=UPI0029B70090|nr:DUF5309 family protein [Streptomyces sp. ND04-05B]MDX3065400.1 DUF5309 family protein [Streptomyces sp. ND04-05B]
MAGQITALGTTYNLPNYTGILHALTPADTPFFSAIGGLTGGGQTDSIEFEWQSYDLRAAGQNVALEGADAPTDENRVRGNVSNIVQIHHETVGVSYTKLAATQAKAGINNAERNTVLNELDWQVEQMLKQMVRDVEYSLLRGVYQKPVDNTTERQTRGLLPAITTNVKDASNLVGDGASTTTAATDVIAETAHGLANGDRVRIDVLTGSAGLTNGSSYYVRDASANDFKVSATVGGSAVNITTDGTVNVFKYDDLTEDDVLDLLQMVWENGGIQESETATLIANAYQKRRLTDQFITQKNYQESSRNVGGVRVTTIETDFGTLNIMLDRHMPTDTLVVSSLEMCMPVYQEIPGKGHFFAEPLARTGAKDRTQLYGEVGLAYGNERTHGKITGLKA